MSLPIDSVLDALRSELQQNAQVILKAPPGAGKSTKLPLSLVTEPCFEGRIILLEPRRLAARNIAHYLAAQLGESVGQRIGFRVRGESKVSAQTRLEIVTEGVLTRMLQRDPELTGVSLVIFDEYHERSLHADTALAFCLESQMALRDDLHLLVMSATLDQQALQDLLPDATYIESQGRSFAVDIHYRPLSAQQYLDEALERAVRFASQNYQGSILVFLPGTGEIKRLQQRLEASLDRQIAICPLYGQLDAKAQQAAIAPAPLGQRKVVLATNIAETSLTIEGIEVVVDSGLERRAHWDAKSGISQLKTASIAQSSAEQRAGRAGRLMPGHCIRLYSESHLQQQAKVPMPEILRSDLNQLALELAQWGCSNASELSWLTPPPVAHLSQAQKQLQQLGALTQNLQLTALGQRMSQIGTEPRLAAMLAQAQHEAPNALPLCAIITALLEDPVKQASSNFTTQLHLFQQQKLAPRYRQRAQQLLQQLAPKQPTSKQFTSKQLTSKQQVTWQNLNWQDIALGDDECAYWLSYAFADRLALKRGDSHRYQLASGQGAQLHQDDPLSQSTALLVLALNQTQQGDSRIFTALPCDIEALAQRKPQAFDWQTVVFWHEEKGALIAEEQFRYGQLILARKPAPSSAMSTEAKQQALAQALSKQLGKSGLSALPMPESAWQKLTRARCAAHWQAGGPWPALDDAALIANVDTWLAPFLTQINRLSQLAQLEWHTVLDSYLGWDQVQWLSRELPTHFTSAIGHRYAIVYHENQPPCLSLRLQEMYGQSQTPKVAEGKQAVMLELLSPAQRPIQRTQDLAGFWQGSYKEVQKEMKGRYPKHVWPDDPAHHQPSLKTKRQQQSS